jgi:hypothetical protein
MTHEADRHLNEAMRHLLNMLQTVEFDMPSDDGSLRAIVGAAYMSGAAIHAEMVLGAGAGTPYVAYANKLMERSRAWRASDRRPSGLIV